MCAEVFPVNTCAITSAPGSAAWISSPMPVEPAPAAAAADPREPAVTPFTNDLVVGVAEHQSEIDGVLRTLSRDWDLDRMPAVDRNLLRIGVFEILWRDDIPDEVVVSEAS